MEGLNTQSHERWVLYLGGMIGGETGANRAVLKVINELFEVVDSERVASTGNDLGVDLVLSVPGDVWVPDYVGCRTGRLSRLKRMLQIQLAVPEGLDIGEAWAFFEDGLPKVYELAKEYTEDHRLGYSLDALKGVIDRVLQRIKERHDT